jgi:hypothetical protein
MSAKDPMLGVAIALFVLSAIGFVLLFFNPL